MPISSILTYPKKLLHPRHSEALDHSWSRNSVIYHVYVRSFKDSNNDGVGDLQGVIDKLDYLNDGTKKSLGIGAIWLSPFYTSPMADFGYDISNHTDVDPTFGNLDTFKQLLDEAHKRSIKVIIELVANHTSNKHPWFLESKISKNNAKNDFYIWRDPKKGGGAPNNWLSVFGGSAWEYVPERKQYYLHSFLKEQPDLNWQNHHVVREVLNILDFWLTLGVDGTRIDAANHLIKDRQFRDEPLDPNYKPGKVKPWYRYLHPYMRNRPELLPILRTLSQFIGSYGDKFALAEARLPIPEMVEYFHSSFNHKLAPLNLHFRNLPPEAQTYKTCIDSLESALQPFDYPNYVLGDHDFPHRLVTRVGLKKARLLAMMQLTLRGMPIIYYGDELGMEDTVLTKIKDKFAQNNPGVDIGRDAQRSPLQWNNEKRAGFSEHKTWLPIAPNFKTCNIKSETKNPFSTLSLYKTLIHLRNTSPALKKGQYIPLGFNHQDIFGYIRKDKKEQFLIVLNFSDSSQKIDLSNTSKSAQVICSSYLDIPKTTIKLQNLILRPEEGYVFKL